MTIHLEFTPKALSILSEERYSHPVPLVQRRMEALWLKSHKLPHEEIAKLVGVCENTIRDYFQLYQEGGVEKLKYLHYNCPTSKLAEHVTSLETHFKEHPPSSIKQAQHDIEVLTGIKRGPTQVRKFCKKNSICVFARLA